MRTPLALAALLAGLSVPAHADAVGDLRACVEASDLRSDQQDCVETVYAACSEASGDTSTAGEVECLGEEIEAWEVLLNAYWPDVQAQAEAQDAQDAGAEGGYSARLLEAQRAWVAYREAECAWQYQRYISGTIRSLIGADCMLGMTADRVLDFREWLADAP
ncbi:lysozyme inhibitor LprI family protein [Fluviibacterium sp. DFM31]|uniref:Lysozyme inhibitor LprI family protein n=1 Tax=Meridianimarinicoccus marinus TaxID=3231483 RepID=A0ABV3L153_9RHOB